MAALFRKILCPVDFSDNSIATLGQAAKLARKDSATVYLLHVEFVPLSNPGELTDYVTVATEPSKRRLEQLARRHLARVRHEIVVKVGRPENIIEKAAQELDVDLIVMATHGRTGINRLILGSVAERLVRTSQRPVLSFGPGTTIGALKHILCTVDFSPNSLAALDFGWRLARDYQAAISLLHVVPALIASSEDAAPMPEREGNARARLEKVATDHLGAAEYKLVVRHGEPGTVILEIEEELRPDLIVMATHGRTGLSHLVLGSVAERTIRESRVPVLTVRGQSGVL